MSHTGTFQYNFFWACQLIKKKFGNVKDIYGRLLILRRILTYRLVVNFRSLEVIQVNF